MLRPTRKSVCGFCVGLFFFLASTRTQAVETPDSCVACHRTISGVKYLEHDFNDWERSIHAKAGITCQACHGGNAAAPSVSEAHKGLKPSTDPSSPVYFTRIPATCGTCHEAEFKAFQKSAHFRELKRSGRGPNCVSCHGSMANHILAPRDLELTCNLCHRRPTQAFATMMALNNAGASLLRLEKTLAEARQKKIDVSAQEKAGQELRTFYGRTVEDWHTFKMAKVLKTSQEITKRVNTVQNEIRLKEQQQSR